MKRFILRHPMYFIAGLIAVFLLYACFLSDTNALAAPLPPRPPGMIDHIDISDEFTDDNFRQAIWEWLGKSGTPGIITEQDILVRLPETDYTLDVGGRRISDLAGLEYFSGLKVFYCVGNLLTELPALPDTLTELNCWRNQLEKLPPLPAGLEKLNCAANRLEVLPSLPESLNMLSCSGNQISSLGDLPAELQGLECDINKLTALPDLPAHLTYLSCMGNKLTALPDLPYTICRLICNGNLLTALPDLPEHINHIECNANRLTSLPSLPDSLRHLECTELIAMSQDSGK